MICLTSPIGLGNGGSVAVAEVASVTVKPHSTHEAAKSLASVSSSKGLKPHSIVRCMHCRKYVFEVIIEVERPAIGPLVTLKNLKCPSCGWTSNIDVAIREVVDVKKALNDRLRHAQRDGEGDTV